jgi:hypothetical protein
MRIRILLFDMKFSGSVYFVGLTDPDLLLSVWIRFWILLFFTVAFKIISSLFCIFPSGVEGTFTSVTY